MENGWKVVLQSNCRSARVMDAVEGGIPGAGATNVELEAVRNVWGNVMNHGEGQGQADVVEKLNAAHEFGALCGRRARGRGGGLQGSQTLHLITLAMQI